MSKYNCSYYCNILNGMSCGVQNTRLMLNSICGFKYLYDVAYSVRNNNKNIRPFCLGDFGQKRSLLFQIGIQCRHAKVQVTNSIFWHMYGDIYDI